MSAQLPQGVLALEWGGQQVWLSPGLTAFLPAHSTLLLADFHLGKAHSFRRLGMPVPGGTTQQMLTRLDIELQRFGARKLVFLGDFLHAKAALQSPALIEFTRWRVAQPRLELWLVRGNHDLHAGDPPPELMIQTVNEPWALGGVRLCHHPEPLEGEAVLAGHRHPAAVLQGPARDRIRLPCFECWPQLLVLPAFGGFTGMHTVPAAAGLQRFVTDGAQVCRLP